MLRACEKRQIPLDVLEDAAYQVERTLRETGRGGHLKGSRRDGNGEARKIDDVAYVRFASVYREFRDLGGFRDEAERILPSARNNQEA
jgi:transcriptional repressor NrdR